MTVHLMLNTLYVPSLPAVNSFHIAPVHDRVMLCTDLSKLIGGVIEATKHTSKGGKIDTMVEVGHCYLRQRGLYNPQGQEKSARLVEATSSTVAPHMHIISVNALPSCRRIYTNNGWHCDTSTQFSQAEDIAEAKTANLYHNASDY